MQNKKSFIEYFKKLYQSKSLSLITSKVLPALGIFISIPLINNYLDPSEAGLAFSLLAVISTQALFDTGTSFAVAQQISKVLGKNYKYINLENNIKNDSSIKKSLFESGSWYRISIPLCFIFNFLFGYFIFLNSELNFSFLYWWFISSIFISAYLINLFACGILDGFQRLRSSSLIKSLYIFSFWFFLDLSLINGLTIKSLYFAFIFSFFTSSIILFFVSSSSLKASYKYIFRINLNLDAYKKQNTNLQFKKFQRRLSISWLSGYISFQLVVPIAYILINPSSAAVLGSLLQYTSGISSLSLSPLMANAPKMGQLQSKKLFQQTKSLYFRRFTIALIIYFTSIFIFIFLIKNNFFFTSFKYGVDFSWFEFNLLISFITINFISSCFAILLRSSAEEPLLIASILQAIVTIILLPFFAKYFKFVGINSSLLISALPSFFLISKLFLIKLRSLEKI